MKILIISFGLIAMTGVLTEGDPRPPVTVFSEAIPCKSDPNQSVLDILTDLVKRIAQTRTDITTAFGGGVDPKTTTATKAQVDAIATTATALAAELKNVQSSLVAGNSIPYNDLIIYVDNIVAYTDGYINGNCFTFTD
ncbi:hypothetical protein BGX24_011020 [Mortierella sp. AD032]|nr:hypothetical protein BGX24_011020 [Mortierella sp. AD032]